MSDLRDFERERIARSMNDGDTGGLLAALAAMIVIIGGLVLYGYMVGDSTRTAANGPPAVQNEVAPFATTRPAPPARPDQ
jgi:hypothetical protein